jgi:hypothetical protein
MIYECFLLRIKVVSLNISHTKDMFLGKFVTLEPKVSDIHMETINIHGNEGEAIELLVVLL